MDDGADNAAVRFGCNKFAVVLGPQLGGVLGGVEVVRLEGVRDARTLARSGGRRGGAPVDKSTGRRGVMGAAPDKQRAPRGSFGLVSLGPGSSLSLWCKVRV